jgi:hypothetical protein
MAAQRLAAIPAFQISRLGIGPLRYPWKVLGVLLLNCFCSILVQAQLPQPLVFSSGGAVALRNDQTGLMTPVAGSPFVSSGQTITVDVQGRFLFSLGTNSIRMFQITDATTGAYQEVPHSPFASPNTKSPLFIAVEPTGKFIAVVNLVGENPGESSVETFSIDTSQPTLPALLPVPGSLVELVSTPVPGGIAQPPDAKKFLIYMGPNVFSSDPVIRAGEDFERVTIDPQTGNLLGIQGIPDNSTGRCFAMDPQGRFVVLGHGQLQGILELRGIAPNFPSGNFSTGAGLFPQQLYIDSTGAFLYAGYEPDPSGAVHILAIDPATAAITQTPSSPLPGTTSVPQFFADPTGPFQYGGDSQPDLLHGFTVDPQTGYFQEISGSPFTIPGAGSLTFSIPSGQQGISGPSIALSTTSLSFGSVQIGSAAAAQMVTLTSNGGEPLAINSIAFSGPDAADFSESDTCRAPTSLQPPAFCSVSVSFQPSTAGPKQATLTVTDNAPGSPHSVPLTGSGVAPPPPAPAVTIAPNPVLFPTTVQGARSNPINITLSNSGNATLHISSVTPGGNNTADFSNASGTCAGAIAPAGTCSLSVTFVPLAAGQRTETLTITDDASDSPQVINVSGSATPAPVPAVTAAPNPAAFQTTTQGTKSNPINITVTNSGAATLHISGVSVGGGNSTDFSNSSGTCSGAIAPAATCLVSVTFAPLTTGHRTETLTVTDDASDSPQVISVSGDATAAIVLGPAPSGSTSISVSAGATAQYQLQLTPGANYTGNVTFTCTGAPLNASCQVPSLTIANGNPMPFTVTVTTSGPAHAQVFPLSLRFAPTRRFPTLLFVLLFASFLGVLIAGRAFPGTLVRKRGVLAGAFVAVIFFALCTASGCGGGSTLQSTTTPAPAGPVTPQGTSTLTVTPSANSVSGTPLQLAPIQLTLTVQ